MGGDSFKNAESSSYLDISRSSSSCSYCYSDGLRFKDGVCEDIFSKLSTDLRRREKAYHEILQSYDLFLRTSKRKLKLARNQILSYTPGTWTDVKLCDFEVPKMTSILIVGPKGSGKSSLINKITRVIEDDEFAPARAQESYGLSSNGGTFFVHEYMFPRGADSASFCLYDTRGLSHTSSSNNISMIEQFMIRGVHHGEPVFWTSDSSDLKDRLIRDSSTGSEMRKVNSVIFVVNGVEILKSMGSEMNETSYAYMICTAFNCPLLSFKDDKPAVVMTHGDMLLLEERARVRVFLGELLGIPPDKQIFDIPESRNTASALTICNLLRYSLEQGDKNLIFLPRRKFTISKVGRSLNIMLILLDLISIALVVCMTLATVWFINRTPTSSLHGAQQKLLTFSSPRLNNLTHEALLKRQTETQRFVGDLNRVRVQNPESEHVSMSVYDGEPSIDWRTTRRLWLDEENMAEVEPSFDRRTTRRLWYVE